MKKISAYFTKTCTYLLVMLFIGMKLSALYPVKKITYAETKTVWINVFVHGIMSIKPHVGWSNFMRFLKDDVEGTLYAQTVQLMREDDFFNKNQAMQQIGLHKINTHLLKGNASASLALIMDEVSKHYGIQENNQYYSYGWRGLLSAKSRYHDARNLFTGLEQEVATLKKQNIIPRIRVIGYSHGGNVALNLGAIHQKEFPESTLTIDELILLGTPLVADTDYLINDPLFKQVFNLYSLADRVQPLDFFAPRQFFSNRIFTPRKGFELPDTLIQIQLKVTRCVQTACENKKRLELSSDFNKPHVLYGKKKLLRDVSPGHGELWFFGWNPVNYRPHYPLHPLPTAAFIPVITHHAKKMSGGTITPAHSIVADIRPEHNIILFRPHNKRAINSSVAYMPKEKLDHLTQIVLECKPALYTPEIYKAHIKDALKQAEKIMAVEKETTN